MSTTLIAEKLRNIIRAFKTNEGGNVAIIFALALVPICGFVGASIDYSRASAARVAMQSAIDSAALMISKELAGNPTMSSSQVSQKANDYFNAIFNRPEALGPQLSVSFDTTATTVTLSASATVNTTFSRIIGKNQFAISTSTTAKWGTSRLRVALALDVTGSMSSAGKIEALKTATKNLLTLLKNSATQNGDVYVSVVPFSRDVNLDPGNYNATYIDWTGWEAPPANGAPGSSVGPGSACPYSNSDEGFRCTGSPTNQPNCNGPGGTSACVSNIPAGGTYNGYICPSADNGNVNSRKSGIYYNGCYDSVPTTTTQTNTVSSGRNASCGSLPNCTCTGSGSNKVCNQTVTTTGAPYTHNWIKNARSTWNGCINDRGTSAAPGTNSGFDQKVDAPVVGNAATLFSAEQYSYCSSTPVMGLNYNWSAMNTLVNNMDTNGSTNQPIGLVWGWQSLVGGGPLTAPAKDPNYKYTEIIILMSDGLNTQDRWYGNGYQTSTDVDKRMYGSGGAGTCKNIKDSGVVLFTVHVNTDGDPMSTLLQNCASPDSVEPKGPKFFHLTSASQIVTTFNTIGTSLTKLRIAK